GRLAFEGETMPGQTAQYHGAPRSLRSLSTARNHPSRRSWDLSAPLWSRRVPESLAPYDQTLRDRRILPDPAATLTEMLSFHVHDERMTLGLQELESTVVPERFGRAKCRAAW